jgi:hypothetical protein
MTRAHGVTHERAENSVSVKTFDTTNTCDTSRILRTWQECTRVRTTTTAEKFRLEIEAEEGVNINYYRFSGTGAIDVTRRTLSSTPPIVAPPLSLSPSSIDQTRSREPPAASRVNLVPEELHDVRGRCADASVSNSLLLSAERVVTKSVSDKSIRRSISDK